MIQDWKTKILQSNHHIKQYRHSEYDNSKSSKTEYNRYSLPLLMPFLSFCFEFFEILQVTVIGKHSLISWNITYYNSDK